MKKNVNKKINWEKVLVYGVTLGWMSSTLYLLMLLAAKIAC